MKIEDAINMRDTQLLLIQSREREREIELALRGEREFAERGKAAMVSTLRSTRYSGIVLFLCFFLN